MGVSDCSTAKVRKRSRSSGQCTGGLVSVSEAVSEEQMRGHEQCNLKVCATEVPVVQKNGRGGQACWIVTGAWRSTDWARRSRQHAPLSAVRQLHLRAVSICRLGGRRASELIFKRKPDPENVRAQSTRVPAMQMQALPAWRPRRNTGKQTAHAGTVQLAAAG